MQKVLVVVVALSALAGALWWFASSAPDVRGGRGEAKTGAPGPVAGEAAKDATPPAALAKAPKTEDARGAEAAAPAPAVAAREEASSKSTELAAAQWVEGRVLLPAGTPEDEELFVIAAGRNFADGSDHRVAVAPDGSFRVAFHEKARSGRFELEGRYLYLAEMVRWKSDEASAPVVLEPKLGARLEGRLVVPEGTGARTVGGALELQVVRRTGNHASTDQVARREVKAELAFAFDALRFSAGQTFELSYDGARFIGAVRGLEPEAGKTLPVELTLRPGVALAGVVRDAGGAPIAGASLFAHPPAGGRAWSPFDYRNGTSAADGTFRLGALEAGKIELQVEHEGYEALERELGPFEAGTDATDLVLVLESGLSISGLVRWPDGTPAEAQLALSPRRTGLRGDWNEANGKSDEHGAFSVAGLAEASYRVTARATRKEEVPGTGEGRTRTQRATWSAEREDVPAGTRDVVLTLSSGFALDGRVVDDLGVPLADFRIGAKRAEPGEIWFGDGDLSRAFRDTNGSFRMEGFTEGEWELVAASDGHAGSQRERVQMPAGKAIVLVVPREVIVRGRVLDPSGAPRPGARVDANAPSFQYRIGFDEKDGLADEQGAFELRGLGPGAANLQANGAGFAPSEVRTLELVAGEPVAGLELVLRTGGSIQGEVVDADGAPVAGEAVWVSAQGYSDHHESDAQGQFLVTGVPPGEVRLWAQTSAGLHLEERVTVVTSETVRVRLAPPARIVRLHGRVLAGGEPLAGANLNARVAEEGAAPTLRSSSAETGEDGSYELNLPGAGRYRLSCSRYEETSLSWSTTVDVPAAESFAFDLSIPVGRISGRVTDTHGAPLAAIEVQSEPERHEHASFGSARALTDEEGRYELLVPAGRHAVAAGASRAPHPAAARPGYARTRVSGLVLEANGQLRGIDLRLERGGTLAGIVRNAEGAVVGRAALQRDEGSRFEYLGWSDEGGRFEVPGVAPGPLLLCVTSRDGATREPVRVEVVAGETTRLEVKLVPAVRVHLSVRQAGAAVGSEITLEGERGQRHPAQTSGQGEAWLGPLVAGRYTVRAQRDGKTVEKAFEVGDAVAEMELELVFE